MRKAPLIGMCLLLALSACSNDKPNELIPEEIYKQMFIEFSIINQYNENVLQETTPDELRQKVYDHYGVTAEEFRVSHRYYERDLDKHLERLTEITNIMRAERDSIMDAEREYNTRQQSTPDTLRSQPVLNR